MKLYSDFPARRILQIGADLLALLVVVLSVWAAVLVHDAVASLAELGRRIEDAGSGLADPMTEAGRRLGGVPFIGKGIRTPFDRAADAGRTLEEAGRTTQDAVAGTATVLAVLVVLVPVALLVWVWLRRRLRFIVRATEAASLARLDEGTEILALRALGSASSRRLRSVSPAPLAGWRDRDPRIVHGLAALELRTAGVRARR